MNRPRSLTVAVLAVLGGLVLSPSAAWSEDAEALYKHGIELRKASQDTEAFQVFKRLNEIEKSSRAKAQLSFAEQALGLWVDAESDLQEALKATDDPWVKKNQKTLYAALQVIQSRLGQIEIWGEPAGAEVLIDGKSAGMLPLKGPVRVLAGNIPVTVRAAGYIERTKVIAVPTSGTAREQFVLNRLDLAQRVESGSGQPVSGQGTGDQPGTGISGGASPPPKDDLPHSDHVIRWRSAAKWIAFGTGGLALAVGVYGTARQVGQGHDFNSNCFVDSSGAPKASQGASKTDSQCGELKSNADSGFHLEIGGFVTAGVLVGAGVVLWLTEPRNTSSDKMAYACAPGLSAGLGPAVSCSWRF